MDQARTEAPSEREARPALIVEWYRLDQSGYIARVLGLGAVFVALGSFMVAAGIAPIAFPGGAPAALFFVGIAFVAGGPLFSIFGLRRLMNDDAYIALRTDGLLVNLPDHEELVPWTDVSEVLFDPPSQRIALAREGAAPVFVSGRMAGITPAALAARIKDVHRKALFGLLRV